MREVIIDDVFAALVPEGLDYTSEEMKAKLTVAVRVQVWDQWAGGERPQGIRFEPIDWLVTDDPVKVEEFQPAHDCEACRVGNERIRVFLQENPGRYVVLGNMRYVEVWAE